mmetsp:Transcript_7019/g.21368  ORF Transcript_7019/g.21368 Transcript_7019/m.21368 type:complete len:208 (+) Transcript_7019:325-948(+)
MDHNHGRIVHRSICDVCSNKLSATDRNESDSNNATINNAIAYTLYAGNDIGRDDSETVCRGGYPGQDRPLDRSSAPRDLSWDVDGYSVQRFRFGKRSQYRQILAADDPSVLATSKRSFVCPQGKQAINSLSDASVTVLVIFLCERAAAAPSHLDGFVRVNINLEYHETRASVLPDKVEDERQPRRCFTCCELPLSISSACNLSSGSS